MAIKENDSLKTKLEKIARAFYEPPHTIPLVAPTKPDAPNDPISLPPSAIMEVIKPTNPKDIVNQRLTEVETKTFDTKPQNPKSTKQNEESIMQKEQTLESLERVKRGRGRPKGSKNKKTIMLEKLSQVNEQSPSEKVQAQGESGELAPLEQAQVQKFSHNEPLPVDLSVGKFTGVKGKTSLCYALLYAQALTPVQITQLLSKADPLNLTTAEVIALKLLKRTEEGDPKAEKIYWEILKNEQKNVKTTPVKSENSLLDEALEKAESAILGEIVVDKETNP